MTEMKEPQIGRREFLKLSGVTTGLAVIGEKLISGKKTSPFKPYKPISASKEDVWLHGYCSMCQQPACATLVHVKDGVVVEMEGDPASPTNAGTLCPRGQSLIMNLYNPYRVKAPVKRTNPNKGLDEDPMWAEISWDEAIDTIAQRLQKIKDTDPRQLVVATGFGSARDYYGAFLSGLTSIIGMPSQNQVPTNGPLCSTHVAVRMTQGPNTCGPDLVYCNYLITIGSSIGANWGTASGPVRGLMDAIDRGMKLVVVDPRAGKESSLGEWVPIRPGSELAFELAFLNVMIYEVGKFDVQFLKARSNAPYLIGAGERYVRDPETNKPMIWDPSDNKAKVFDDPSIVDYALEGEFEVEGQTVQPGFALIKAGMKTYTPEWAEPITTIPAATIRRLATEFVEAAQIGSTIVLDGMEFPLRPVMIWPKRGALSQQDGAYVHFASKVIQGLVGALDVPGGDQGNDYGPFLVPNEDGVVTPVGEAAGKPWGFPIEDVQLSAYFPFKHTTPYLAYRTIIDPEKYHVPYDVDTIIVYGSNPIINNAAPDEPREAFKKVPFVASIAYHFDEPAILADIVLPEASRLEREVIRDQGADSKGKWSKMGVKCTMYRHPVIPALHNTKRSEEIFMDLAERMDVLKGEGGLLERVNKSLRLKPEYALDINKTYTLSEIVDLNLKSRFGEDKGSEYFKSVGYQYELLDATQTYNYAYYPMGTTRYHIFFEHVKAIGDKLKANLESEGITIPGWDMDEVWEHYHGVPVWRPMPIHQEPDEYDLYFVNWKTPFVLFGLGATVENPWLHEIAIETDPYQMVLSINPIAAEKKGLKDGDLVEVSSQWGSLTGQIKISSLLHSEVIGTPGNYGRRSMLMNPISQEGPNYNQLLSPEDGFFDPINTSLAISPRVKVRKI